MEISSLRVSLSSGDQLDVGFSDVASVADVRSAAATTLGLSLANEGVLLIHEGCLLHDEVRIRELEGGDGEMTVVVQPNARQLQRLREASGLVRSIADLSAVCKAGVTSLSSDGWYLVNPRAECMRKLLELLGRFKGLCRELSHDIGRNGFECWGGGSCDISCRRCMHWNCDRTTAHVFCEACGQERPVVFSYSRFYCTCCYGTVPRASRENDWSGVGGVLHDEFLAAWESLSTELQRSGRKVIGPRREEFCSPWQSMSDNLRSCYHGRRLRLKGEDRLWPFRPFSIRCGSVPFALKVDPPHVPKASHIPNLFDDCIPYPNGRPNGRWDKRLQDACVPCRLKVGIPDLLSAHFHRGCGRTKPRLVTLGPRKCELEPHEYYTVNDYYTDDGFSWYKESREFQRACNRRRAPYKLRCVAEPETDSASQKQRCRRQTRHNQLRPRGGRFKPGLFRPGNLHFRDTFNDL